jgi:hypothetical protein
VHECYQTDMLNFPVYIIFSLISNCFKLNEVLDRVHVCCGKAYTHIYKKIRLQVA